MKQAILSLKMLTLATLCIVSTRLYSQENALPSPDELLFPTSREEVNKEQDQQIEFVDEVQPDDIVPTVQNEENNQQESAEVEINTSTENVVEKAHPVQETLNNNTQKSPIPTPLRAEQEHNGWMISVHGGSNLFYGDVTVYPLWPAKEYNNERKWAMGISLDKEFNKFLQLRGNLLYGTLSGTKREYSNGAPANMYFDATLFEYSLALKATYNAENPLSVYAYAGLGFVHFRSQLKDLRTDAVITSYGYDHLNRKTSPTVETMAPLGIGVDYRFTENLSVNLDISLRIVNTDKLDGKISNPDPFFQDMYGYTAIGLSYRFGRNSVSVVPDFSDDYRSTSTTSEFVSAEDEKEDLVTGEYSETIVVDSTHVLTEEKATLKHEAIIMDKSTTKQDLDEVVLVEKNQEQEDLSAVKSAKKETKESPTQTALPSSEQTLKSQEDITKEKALPKTTEIEKAQRQSIIVPKEQEVKTEVAHESAPSQKIEGLVYRIQIIAVQTERDERVIQLVNRFNIEEEIFQEYNTPWYRYSVGNFSTLQEANNYRQLLVEKGLSDSFVVPFHNGVRISVQQARDLQQ